jgi:outer membrane receptor protein involved in Fe transport
MVTSEGHFFIMNNCSEMKKSILFFLSLVLIISFHTEVLSQYIVKGKILDSNSSEALPQAIVMINKKAVFSDFDGNFTINCSSKEIHMEIKYLGYITYKLDTVLSINEYDFGKIYLQENTKRLNEVTITSGKFKRAIEDVTVSIETVKPDFLEKNNLRKVDDILEKIPGVNFVDGQVSIRGGSGFAYGAGSRVMVLIDNMPALQFDSGYPNWGNIATETIGKLEVQKGAGSALYGSAAMNGVINILSLYAKKEPLLKIKSFYTVYDNPADTLKKWWDRAPASFGFSGVYAKKFGNLDLIGSLYYSREDSYKKYCFSDNSRATLNLDYHITESWTTGIHANVNKGTSLNYFYWKNSKEGAYIGTDNAYAGQDKNVLIVDPYISFLSKNGTKHLLQSRYYSVSNLVSGDKSNKAYSYYTEYQFQKNFYKNSFVITSGLVNTYSKTNAELYGDTVFVSNNSAAYLQLEKRFFRKLNLIAGGRYELNKVKGPVFIRGINVSEKYSSESKPVFRLGANFKLFPFTNIRGSWGQGFRYPTIAEKFTNTYSGQLLIYPNPDLKSETGYTIEFGLRQGLKIKEIKGFFDISAFQSDYNDMIEFALEFNKVPYFNAENIGNTSVKGIELSSGFTGKIGKCSFETNLGYSYIDPKYRNFNDTVKRNLSVDYNILKYRYKHTARVDFQIQYSSFSLGFGSSYNSFMEAVDKIFEQDVFIKDVKTYRLAHNTGSNIFRANLAYTLRELTFQINIDNLFNKEYSVRPGLLEAPRSMSVSFSYNLQKK